MTTTNSQEVYNAVNGINKNLLDAYEIIKNYNFHRAEANAHTLRGERNNYIKEFSVKNKLFRFKFRKTNYAFNAKEAESYFNEYGTSKKLDYPFLGLSYSFDLIHLMILEERKKLNGKISVNEGRFRNIDDFTVYFSRGYERIKDGDKIIETLSGLPNDMLDIYDRYNEDLRKKQLLEKAKYDELIDKINKNIGRYESSINYIELYECNPEYLIKKLGELPEKDKEKVLGKIIKNTKFQAHKELDRIISEKFSKYIQSAGRKGIKK